VWAKQANTHFERTLKLLKRIDCDRDFKSDVYHSLQASLAYLEIEVKKLKSAANSEKCSLPTKFLDIFYFQR